MNDISSRKVAAELMRENVSGLLISDVIAVERDANRMRLATGHLVYVGEECGLVI